MTLPKNPKLINRIPLAQFAHRKQRFGCSGGEISVEESGGSSLICLRRSHDGIVYAADAYGFVAAIDHGETGRFQWTTRIGRPRSKGFMNVVDRSDPAFVTGGIGRWRGYDLCRHRAR